jgi:hypothetical protein
MEDEKLMAHRVEKTDSSAALRNDKQKNRQRQKQKEQAKAKRTGNGKSKGEMRGFFPFDKLRVRMTTFEEGLGVDQELAVAHDLLFAVGVA